MSETTIEEQAAAILAEVNGLNILKPGELGHTIALRAVTKALGHYVELVNANREQAHQRDQLLTAIAQGAREAGMLRAEVAPTGPQAIQLAGDMGAELARLATVTQITQDQFDAATAQVAHAIGGCAYDCTRAWSAWSYNTMRSDDFVEIASQDDRVDEITRAALLGAGLSVSA